MSQRIIAAFVGDPHDLIIEDSTGMRRAPTSGGVNMYGVQFPLNAHVDISSMPPAQIAKIRNNTHFQVIDECDDPPAPPPADHSSDRDDEPFAPAAQPDPAPRSPPAAAAIAQQGVKKEARKPPVSADT